MEIRTEVSKDGVIVFDSLCGVDLNGNPVRRSMREYPYSYDEFVVWKSSDYQKSADNHVVHSDRMFMPGRDGSPEGGIITWQTR